MNWSHMSATHHLFPSPVLWHEVLKTMLTICTVFLIRSEVKFTLELRIANHFVNKELWIMKPHVVVHSYPWWGFTIRPKNIKWRSIVLQSENLPGNISWGCSINCVIHFLSILERWRVIMRGQRSCSEACDEIDVTGRHLVAVVQEVCDFKLNLILVWGSAVIVPVWFMGVPCGSGVLCSSYILVNHLQQMHFCTKSLETLCSMVPLSTPFYSAITFDTIPFFWSTFLIDFPQLTVFCILDCLHSSTSLRFKWQGVYQAFVI